MFRTFTAAAFLGLASLTALPATADGTLTISWNAQNQREADALRLALGLYSLHQHIEAGGTVRQWGENNAAALAQQGNGNWGLIEQRGSGHTGTLTQAGNGNAHALIQTGNGAVGHVTQVGNGQAGITLQVGF